MADNPFPYTPTVGKLEEFLTKLQSIQVPPKIDTKYLSAVGFASSHSRPFIPIMKKVGLLNSSGEPTEIYTKGLRGDGPGRAIVAAGIQAGYDSMYKVFGDAHSRSNAELATFMKSHSTLDDRKIGLAVSTFKTLCKFGDFDAVAAHDADDQDDDNSSNPKKRQRGMREDTSGQSGSVTINVNIALSVDATSDPEVYDAFFGAMAKHIKVLDGGASNTA